MDDAGKIIAELQLKLKELDCKVAAYRQDMTSEYSKYAENLLQGTSEELCVRIKKVLAEAVSDYPALAPSLGSSLAPSYPEATSNADDSGFYSPKCLDGPNYILPVVSLPNLPAVDVIRDPHAREAEFTGLFTPSYLPLLDSNDRNERRSSAEISSGIKSTAPISIGASAPRTSTPTALSSSYDPSSSLPKPPTPRRRNTDEVSIVSDGSDGTKRRSALRRTSSSAKSQSPRRVRFEFEGIEVSTTSSPKPPAPIGQMVEAAAETDMVSSLLESDDEAGAEQVEDIDAPPPPRRISSTQRLQMLSRGPIDDDGTKWTEVVAPDDGSASVEKTDDGNGGDDDEDDSSDDGFLAMSGSKRKTREAEVTPAPSANEPSEAVEAEDVLSDMPSQADLQSVRSSSLSPRGAVVIASPPQVTATKSAEFTPVDNVPLGGPSGTPANSLPSTASDKSIPDQSALSTPATAVAGPKETEEITAEDSDEEFFGFEESTRRESKKYINHDSSDDDEPVRAQVRASGATDQQARNQNAPNDPRNYPMSPARFIMPQNAAVPKMGSLTQNVEQTRSSNCDTPQESTPVQTQYVANPNTYHSSSYNIQPPPMLPTSPTTHNAQSRNFATGYHPFSDPVIDPALHNTITKMKMNSFVGSVNGKSGLDESAADDAEDERRVKELAKDLGPAWGSFRDTTVGSLGGPRSLSERMRLEDYMGGNKGGRWGMEEDDKDS